MLTSTLVTTNALQISLPNSSAESIKKQIISISITEDRRYFINSDPVEKVLLESKIKALFASEDNPTLTSNLSFVLLEISIHLPDEGSVGRGYL